MSKDRVSGILFFGKQGRAKVFVEGLDEPISLARGASGTALHGDLVELQVLGPRRRINIKEERVKESPSKPDMK